MSILKEKYGEIDGKKVYKYTLDNQKGLVAEILSYGGIIAKLIFCGTDVVLGLNSLEEYLDNDGYFGAIIGRNANRIENARFLLNNDVISLCKNDGNNNLHGGKSGFNAKIWDAEVVDTDEPSLVLTRTSPDGEEGFPGEVHVKVTYKLTPDNALTIRYEGVSDKDTVLNMTNHSYFNLNGHNSGTIDGHTISVCSSFYTQNNEECIPTGAVLSVKDTPFDLQKSVTLGERLCENDEQIKMFGGFDHNFIIDESGYRLAAVLKGDQTGILMHTYTDQAGVQLYTANAINDKRVCKDGAVYPKHAGLCLETQAFPNNLNHKHFPSSVLKKGKKYDTTTAYKFFKLK